LTGFGRDAFKRISANGAWRGATVDRVTWLITAGWSAAPADGWLLRSFSLEGADLIGVMLPSRPLAAIKLR
jgi:hypothetical protein